MKNKVAVSLAGVHTHTHTHVRKAKKQEKVNKIKRYKQEKKPILR